MTKPTGRPVGRPSIFTEDMANKIFVELTEGKSLIDICAPDDMPHRVTVYRWMDQRPEFAARIVRGREGQADYVDHMIARIAEDCSAETALADRVKLAACQWRAARLNPRRYGDRTFSQHEIGPPGSFSHLSDEELTKLIRDEAKVLAIAFDAGEGDTQH